MKIFSLIALVVSLLTWAQAKQNTQIQAIKPADTRGEVALSNEQFQAASQFANKQGIKELRVLSVKKRTDCGSDLGAYFEIKFGSTDSIEKKTALLKVAKNLSVEIYQGSKCTIGNSLALLSQ